MLKSKDQQNVSHDQYKKVSLEEKDIEYFNRIFQTPRESQAPNSKNCKQDIKDKIKKAPGKLRSTEHLFCNSQDLFEALRPEKVSFIPPFKVDILYDSHFS